MLDSCSFSSQIVHENLNSIDNGWASIRGTAFDGIMSLLQGQDIGPGICVRVSRAVSHADDSTAVCLFSSSILGSARSTSSRTCLLSQKSTCTYIAYHKHDGCQGKGPCVSKYIVNWRIYLCGGAKLTL